MRLLLEPTRIGSRTTTARRLFLVAMAGLAIVAPVVNDEESSGQWVAGSGQKKVGSGEWGVGRHDVDGSPHSRQSLRLAIQDLIDTFAARYGSGAEFLARWDALRSAKQFQQLKRDALLANPLLDFDRLILLKRKRGQLGLPVNHKCNSGIAQTGYDNEIAVLSLGKSSGQWGVGSGERKVGSGQWGVVRHDADGSPRSPLPTRHSPGKLQTLFRPKGTEFVGEIDLHFDADRLLFTMPNGRTWQIHEISIDGSGLRQLSRGEHPDVDNFDACYLPDGRIVFASTASYHAVPCWHGKERACALYVMGKKVGSGEWAVGRQDANESPHSPLTTPHSSPHSSTIRQLCFDQDLDLHPAVLPNGQIIFSRWDYTGPMHIYLRPLMAMNPDGTAQRAIYGSNSYWPNALYYPRGIPGTANKIVAIVAGYHGVPRMGELVVLDTTRGWHEADGVVQRIPGRGKPVVPIIRDKLVDQSWPKFLHPYPLSEKYFLVAAQLSAKASWGIYLVDVFDNILPICVLPQFDLFEPIPLRKTPRPPVLPDRVDLSRNDAVVYLHDVYAGPGLRGVPRGTVRRLRIVAYHFGYPGMAGPDKIGCGGPWEVMRILGTVPVDKDGSVAFRVPANTPLSVQPLDAEGKAVQLMRSWFTAMPGETVSCVGCHERPGDAPLVRYELAATREPREIDPWYGPPRGFDFEREVQPVLDRYCVGCHNDRPREDELAIADLRAERFAKNYQGRELTKLGSTRLHPDSRKALGGTAVRYTPAYEALIPYIRRVNVEDHVGLLVPGEYHADTSELIQLLRKGHHGVRLDDEAWDRLVTWIDLNGPCHGSWNDVCPVPEGADRRRRELSRLYGGPEEDAERVYDVARRAIVPIVPELPTTPKRETPHIAGWPFDAAEARRRQTAAGEFERTVNLGDGVTMQLARIPAGRFVTDEVRSDRIHAVPPVETRNIENDFWIGTCEVTNEQFHRFDPTHDSGLFAKRFQGPDGPGLLLADARQPVVRVSWQQAAAFCRWLSERTGMAWSLPSEAQWEYAARAGTGGALWYGTGDTDFSGCANLADKSLSLPPRPTGGLESNITAHHGKGIFLSAIIGGNVVCDARYDDGAVATAPVAHYRANPWGLFDVHGNAAEWTATDAGSSTGRRQRGTLSRKIVRGGSWLDRPARARSSFRLDYPAWQRVHNVGFRVVCEAGG